MNCPNCGAPPDYRFSTRCSYCESDLSTANESPNSLTTLPTAKDRRALFRHAADALVILLSSSICTIAGAVLAYCAGGLTYLMFFVPHRPNSCGEGAAVMVLSVLAGGFLGCIGGSIVGYKIRFESETAAKISHELSIESGSWNSVCSTGL